MSPFTYRPHAPPVSPNHPIPILLTTAQKLVSKSWEHGTFCETLLEVYDLELSVFGREPFGSADLAVPSLDVRTGANGVEVRALKWAMEMGMEERIFGRESRVEVRDELVERRAGDGEYRLFR